MKGVTRILLSFGAVYALLLLLSVLVIVPRYLTGGLANFLLALVTDTEPEGRFVGSFYSPLIWTLIPLTSMGLCLIAWICYNASFSSVGSRRRLSELAFAFFFIISFVPAALVVRQLLLISVPGAISVDYIRPLTGLAYMMKTLVNPALLLGKGGVWIAPLIIFVETGLFFGFFLPGDSLLLTIGVLAAVGQADLSLLILLSIIAAIIGDQLGYAAGSRLGTTLGHRYQFVRENMGRATEFYAKHGGKAVVLARFIPVVRTFAPIVAGAASMSYWRFTVFNIVGGTFWVVSVTTAGFFVGTHAPMVADYLTPLILAVIITSPLAWMLAWLGNRPSPIRNRGTP